MSENPYRDRPLNYGAEDQTYLETDSMAVLQGREGVLFRLPAYTLREYPTDFYIRYQSKWVHVDEAVENFLRYEHKNPSASTLHDEVVNAETEFAHALDAQHSNRKLETPAVNLNDHNGRGQS